MIPRAKRSPFTSFLVGLYKLVILPIIVLWIITEFIVGLFLGVLALPWTLHYYSSNHGLLRPDRKLTRRHAEQIQRTNDDVSAMMSYLTRRTAHSHAAVAFYPHDAEDSYCCFPGKASFETAYSYPSLSKLFMSLDEAGWSREVVYDLFTEMATDPDARKEIQAVKRRACRGGILRRTGSIPPYHSRFLYAWTNPPPTLLEGGDQNVVEVDMSSAAWVLTGGATLRPRNEETLCALEKLNEQLDMWKFVTSENDFKEKGCWQYVVR